MVQSPARHVRVSWLALLTLLGVLLVLTPAGRAAAAVGDVGHQGPSYTGAYQPPSADKPQSKLWFNDGRWWADMFDATSQQFHIFWLDRSTESWTDTSTLVDARPTSSPDTLWDGTHLYIASNRVTASTDANPVASDPTLPARLFRFSYSSATKTYTKDVGFPVDINSNSSESLTIDKDSTGKLWATWTQVSADGSGHFSNAVYVNATTTTDTTWGTPFVLPTATPADAHPNPDDISTIVAYNGHIGVLWSNQAVPAVYWASHVDGTAVGTWSSGVALSGPRMVDDHVNIKWLQADPSGRVFAVVKTSQDVGGANTAPAVQLLAYKPATDTWTPTPIWTVADCPTRPIVMLDAEHSVIHAFATAPTAGCAYSGLAGSIFEKTSPMDSPAFAAGKGTPVITDAASPNVNDATGSKQGVNSASGLVVLATNDKTHRYWFSDQPLVAPPVQWQPVGGITTGSPAVATSGPGKVDVVVRGTDDAVWTRSATNGTWGAWRSIGGMVTEPPVVTSSGTGKVEVFVRGADGAVWTKSATNGTWDAAWTSVGGIIVGVPAVTTSGPGMVDVAVRGTDDAVWTRSATNGTWGAWKSIGGIVTDVPAVTSSGSGKVDVVVRGADGTVWVKSASSGVWGEWKSAGGGVIAGAPAVTSSGANKVDVVVRGTNDSVSIGSAASGIWGAWQSLGGIVNNAPAVTSSAPGKVDIVVRGADGLVWTGSVLNGSWSGWRSLGGVIVDAAAVTSSSTGRLDILRHDDAGEVWYHALTTP
jgi:hypothetical protein